MVGYGRLVTCFNRLAIAVAQSRALLIAHMWHTSLTCTPFPAPLVTLDEDRVGRKPRKADTGSKNKPQPPLLTFLSVFKKVYIYIYIIIECGLYYIYKYYEYIYNKI